MMAAIGHLQANEPHCLLLLSFHSHSRSCSPSPSDLFNLPAQGKSSAVSAAWFMSEVVDSCVRLATSAFSRRSSQSHVTLCILSFYVFLSQCFASLSFYSNKRTVATVSKHSLANSITGLASPSLLSLTTFSSLFFATLLPIYRFILIDLPSSWQSLSSSATCSTAKCH